MSIETLVTMTATDMASTLAGLSVDCDLRRGAFALGAHFTAPAGVTVLLGPSGAGKSLTLQSIVGLLTPSAGRIALGSRALYDGAKGLNLPTRLRRIGYVPQFSALFPHLSVGENIAYGLPARRCDWWRPGLPAQVRAKDAARVEELLALVRLSGFATRMPGTLSGGQAQRVALARALASEPEALLLDEPLSALDTPTRVALRSDLRAVLAASGVPALFVTHDLEEARALADRLVVLLDGRVVAEGRIAEVLATPPTAEAALLLGWGNVLPVAGVWKEGMGAHVTLPGGQEIILPACATSPLSPHEGAEMALALRADRLQLANSNTSVGADTVPGAALLGRLLSITDFGPYLALSVALDSAEELPPLRLSCSPREVAALAFVPGDSVRVCVPPEAVRLVHTPSVRM